MRKNKSFQDRIAFVFFCLVIAGASIGIFISRRMAMQNAIQQCTSSFDLIAEEPPSITKMQINTYKLNPAESLGIVWTVDIKGKWLFPGGPMAEGQVAVEPQRFDRCSAIIDAFTGSILQDYIYPVSVDKESTDPHEIHQE